MLGGIVGFIKFKYLWYLLAFIAIYLIMYQILTSVFCSIHFCEVDRCCCMCHNELLVYLKVVFQSIVSTIFYFSVGIMTMSIIITSIRHIKNNIGK